LAGKTATCRVVAKEVEHIELVFAWRLEQLRALQHVDSASAAARASAGEWDGRSLLVAKVDQTPPGGGVGHDHDTPGGFEDDDRH